MKVPIPVSGALVKWCVQHGARTTENRVTAICAFERFNFTISQGGRLYHNPLTCHHIMPLHDEKSAAKFRNVEKIVQSFHSVIDTCMLFKQIWKENKKERLDTRRKETINQFIDE